MEYVIITGAYGGMGKATAIEFAKKGYAVFALDKRVEEQTEKNIIPIQTDITSESSVKKAFDIISAVTDSVKAIIHFAGIYVLDSLVEISEENFIRAFNVNLFGAFRVNKCFLPLLKKGSRVVITTSELAPLYPLPYTGLYAITKGALEKYANSLRMELTLFGISVSVIRPGAVKTGLLNDSQTALDKFVANTKLYNCNANNFQKVVNGVETKNVEPEKVAKKALKAVTSKRPKYLYNLNRNFLLLLLNALPKRMQVAVIKMIIK